MNRFRKIIERHINIQMGTLEKPDGSITEPGQETLHHLTSAHFGKATKHEATIYEDNKYITLDEVKDWKPNWISASKLELAIHQFKNKKSPGPDGLSPLVLKNLPSVCIHHILFLYLSLIHI